MPQNRYGWLGLRLFITSAMLGGQRQPKSCLLAISAVTQGDAGGASVVEEEAEVIAAGPDRKRPAARK